MSASTTKLPQTPEPAATRRPQPGLLWAVPRAIAVTIFLGLSLLLTNALQTLSLGLLPFSRRAFRRFNRGCANAWWGACVLIAERLYGFRLELLEDSLPPEEDAIVIANHQCGADILVVMMLAWRKGRLGDLKWFVKDIIKYAPGVGWGMLFLGCVFLKRDWNQDQQRIEATFHRLVSEGLPFWLVSFPEGTRIRPAKLRKAQELAAQKGLLIPRHTLLPRPKGFVAAVQGLRPRAAAVYDLTIEYDQGIPTLVDLLLGRAAGVRLRAVRTPMTEIPQDPKELAQWLVCQFQLKDEALDRPGTVDS